MERELQAVLGVLGHRGFLAGLTGGVVGAALIVAVNRMTRRPLVGWGLVLTAAVVGGLASQYRLDLDLTWWLVGVLGVGLFVDVTSRRGMPVAMTAGTWALAGLLTLTAAASELARPSWIWLGFPFAVVGLALGIWRLGRLSRSDLIGPMFAMSVAGAWVTVPETGLVAVMLGAAIPMGLITLRPVKAGASATGALALASVFAFLSADGGIPRPWTIVAAWAASATIPLAASVVSRVKLSNLALLLIHVSYIALITRVADYTESVVVVFLSFLALIAAVAAVVLFIIPRMGATEERDS